MLLGSIDRVTFGWPGGKSLRDGVLEAGHVYELTRAGTQPE